MIAPSNIQPNPNIVDFNQGFDQNYLADLDLSTGDLLPVHVFNTLLPNAAAFYNHKITKYENITKEFGKRTTTSIRENDQTRQQSEVAQRLFFEPDLTSLMTSTHRETVTTIDGETNTLKEYEDSGVHQVHLLNKLGYIPVISTVTGLYRMLVGLALLVKSVACAIFDSKNAIQHRTEMAIAYLNIVRGFFELIPVIGNLFVLNLDLSRMTHRWSDFKDVKYADRHTIPAFQFVDSLDAIGMIPVLGTITSVLRVVFFFFHALVNIPGLACNERSAEAIKFSCAQIGLGLLEMIPIFGSITGCCINLFKAVDRIES